MACVFDVDKFRSTFPSFNNGVLYTDAMLEGFYTDAGFFVSGCGCDDEGNRRERMLYLMTAHLTYLQNSMMEDGDISITQSASVDKVSISLAMPPYGTSPWKFWLNTSPYGKQLLALLTFVSAGGKYIGGRNELAAFRKARGRFF